MSNVLTQEEIDALLAASTMIEDSGSGQSAETFVAPGNAMSAKPTEKKLMKPSHVSKVSLYDFRRPNKFSKDHMRHIQMIHDNFARILKPTLSFHLRTNVFLRLIYIEQHTYEEFTDLANNQTLFAILSFLKGRSIIGIDIPITLVIIEKILGGEGNANLTRRELTDIEMSLFHRLLERIISSLTEAWGSILTSTPKIEATENNPQVIQIVSPNEIVLKLVIELSIGEEHTGNITLCYPYVSLASIIDELGSYQWITSEVEKTFTKTDEEFLNRRVNNTKIPLALELGTTKLLARDILNLQVGDIIKLERKITDPLSIRIGNKVKFLAQSGILGKNIAARIMKVIYPDKDENYIERIMGTLKKMKNLPI